MARVSVVVPTYDRPEFLGRAVETARNQTLTDLEVVVVDDGSETDYASEVVADYPDTVRCVAHDENRGLSAARNTGIDHATGEYVAFLDDDDLWHEAKLATQVRALEDDPDAALASCRTAAITPSGSVLRCEGSRPGGDLSREILVSNVVGSPSRVVVPAAHLREVRFDEDLPTKQDWDFYIRLCRRGTVAVVPEWYCFRVVHESMSSDPAAAERDIGRVLSKHESAVREAGLWEQAVADYETRVGRAYLDAGDRRTARRHLAAALSSHSRLRPLFLYLLALLPVGAVDRCIDAKRLVERATRDCDGITLAHGVDLS